MADRKRSSEQFRRIWQAATDDYARLTGLDLNHTSVDQPQSLEELFQLLRREHSEYREDSKSSKFTGLVKNAIGPFNFLTSTVGSTVAPMFPGGSQVLAAVGVLVNAAKNVTGAFDAVNGLFERIGNFTGRLAEVSNEEIPESLIGIYQAMLVSMLKVFGLATMITKRSMKEVRPGEKNFLHKLKKAVRPAFANIEEYAKQLLLGGDADIDGAVKELKTLVDNEALMMGAVTVRKATRIEAITVDIQGLNIEMRQASYEIKDDTSKIRIDMVEVRERIESMQLSMDRFAAGMEVVEAQNRSIAADVQASRNASKVAYGQQMTAIETIQRTIDGLARRGGLPAQAGPVNMTADKTTKKRNPIDTILNRLKIRKPALTNAITYERINAERLEGTNSWVLEESSVKDWLEGDLDCLLVSGNSGTGKTFLASYIVQHLLSKYKQGSQETTESVAYYINRRGQSEVDSVDQLLRIVAAALAANDMVYAKHVQNMLDDEDLWNGGTENLEINRDHESPVQDVSDGFAQLRLGDDVEKTEDAGDGSTALKEEAEAQQDVSDSVDQDTPLTERDQLSEKISRIARALGGHSEGSDLDGLEAVQDIYALWRILFSSYYDTANASAYIVIDAVNECIEAEAIALLVALSNVNGGNKPRRNLKTIVFVDFTMADTFVASFPDRHIAHLPIDTGNNHGDLVRYIENRMMRVWQDTLISKATVELVRDTIVKDSRGSFLKATLLVDETTSLSRESLIRAKLKELPETLDEAAFLAIGRFERQLDHHEVEDLYDILSWTACARRDLSLAELDALLQIRHPDGARVIDLEHRLKSKFTSLFSLSDTHNVVDEKTRLARLAGVPVVHSSGNSVTVPPNNDRKDNTSSGNEQRANERMSQTYVSLKHTLIKEQIQKQVGSTGSTDLTTGDMQAKVLLKCLDTICGDHALHDTTTVELACGYSAVFLPEHLTAVNPDELPLDTRVLIARELLQLLRDEACLNKWVQFTARFLVYDLLDSEEFHKQTINLLSHPELQDQLSEGERAWVKAASEEPIKVLFEGVARAASRKWLLVTGICDDFFGFLNTYMYKAGISRRKDQVQEDATLNGEDAEDNKPDPDEVPDLTIAAATKESVLRAARWTQFEENAMWHARVGVALRSAKLHDDSVEFYLKALEMDPGCRIFRAGLSVTYAEQDEYEKAVVRMSEAVEIGMQMLAENRLDPLTPESSMQKLAIWDQQDLAQYQNCLGQREAALKTYEVALQTWESIVPQDDEWDDINYTAAEYFRTLCDAKEWQTAITFLGRMTVHPFCGTEAFILVHNLLQNTAADWSPRIAYETGNLAAIDQWYLKAINTIAQFGVEGLAASVRYSWGRTILLLDPGRQNEALALLSATVEDEEVQDASDDYAFVKDRAERALARAHIGNILTARAKDEWRDVGASAHSLVSLLTAYKTPEGKVAYGTRDSSHVLAAWERINGRLDRARECVDTALRLGLEMLSDDDPENDTSAWIHLSDALLALGDADHAIAAVNMLRQSRMPDPDPSTGNATEAAEGSGANGIAADDRGSDPAAASLDDHITTTTQPETPAANASGDEAPAEAPADPPTDVGAFFSCDGSCFGPIPNNAKMYRCSYCIADFCERCHALIAADGMRDWAICGSTHDHVEVPAIAGKYGAGNIRVRGGGEVGVGEWVAGLREKWV